MPTIEEVLMQMRKHEMMSFVEQNPESKHQLARLALEDNYPLSWRAAWLIHGCMVDNEKLLQDLLPEILNALSGKMDGHQRELLRILMRLELDEESEGMLFDKCVTIWEQPGKKSATRYQAMRFILKMAEKYSELKDEIVHLAQEYYLESLSPGIRHSLKKQIKSLVS